MQIRVTKRDDFEQATLGGIEIQRPIDPNLKGGTAVRWPAFWESSLQWFGCQNQCFIADSKKNTNQMPKKLKKFIALDLIEIHEKHWKTLASRNFPAKQYQLFDLQRDFLGCDFWLSSKSYALKANMVMENGWKWTLNEDVYTYVFTHTYMYI